MSLFAEIIVNVPTIIASYHYGIPGSLEQVLKPGHLVEVPFGKQQVHGVVWSISTTSAVQETRSISALLDPLPVLTSSQMQLAKKMSEATLNPLAAIISIMLPPGLASQADTLYTLAKEGLDQDWSDTQKRLVRLLSKRGSLRGRQIDHSLPKREWRKSIPALVKSGYVVGQSFLPPTRVHPKLVKKVQIAIHPEKVEEFSTSLGKTTATQKRRAAALEFLAREKEAVDVSWVYAESGCNLADLQELAEKDLVTLFETEIWRDPLSRIPLTTTHPPPLTSHQKIAWDIIEEGFNLQATGNTPEPYLLHGVTGSGKTEIYLRAVERAIQMGKRSIVLVPEISITPQTVRRFMARFPGRVGLVHSKLSEGERYDTWRRARLGLLDVIIGPRSALFTPFPNIGLIVLDECHDGSYYQNDPPFYHADQTAVDYAKVISAVLILGSATPPIALKYQAERSSKKFEPDARETVRPDLQLVELPERITPQDDGGVKEGTSLPPVKVVDMRQELKSGNRGIFSTNLDAALNNVLDRNEQAILFLNRRGTAMYVFCRDCGRTLVCPRCDLPLTYHTLEGGERLLCHRCGHTTRMPKTCPNCHGTSIRQYGLGSERVVSEVRSRFPKANVLQWDFETTRQKDAHEIILGHFISQRANVLVGTQMLAKGLDLPRVTLVGIVLADVGLNLPDPFAAERVFQVLTQVAGRAGRSSLGGQVILQTFQPENYVIQAAAAQDYHQFYIKELSLRKRLGYPPFGRLIRLEFRHRDVQQAEQAAVGLAASIRSNLKQSGKKENEILEPLPCYFAKENGLYRWQIILRGPNPQQILPSHLKEGWRMEIDPPSLL